MQQEFNEQCRVVWQVQVLQNVSKSECVCVCAYVYMCVWVRVCVYAHAWTCSSNQSVTLQLFIMQLPVQNDARQHLGTHVKHSLAVQL